MDSDLKIIKKKYGEEMAHFCRDAFPTILEQEGVLTNLLLKWFEPSKFLYKDLQQEDLEMAFKDFIYKQFDQKREEKSSLSIKTPQELLSEAGYDLYECKSEEDIQSFKKYYAPGEELCTFRKSENRLEKCHVFFAVKKDVDTIKREDFKNPQRQDLYGTSVISIQFDRNEYHILSIKNRYNHTVKHCDSTFSNNLDNIIEGLTDSFAQYYGLEQSFVNQFEIPSYVQDSNGKYYKYNYEIDNDHYCSNNIILKQHEPIRLPKERYILVDYFIIDMKENTILNYAINEDSFPKMFQDNPIKRISVEAKTNSKMIHLETMKGLVTLEIDNENRLIGLDNPYIEEIEDYFLAYDYSLTYLNLSNVQKMGNNCLFKNRQAQNLYLPNVRRIGNCFMFWNDASIHLNLDNLVEIGTWFLAKNNSVINLNLESIEIIGTLFMPNNHNLVKIRIPNNEQVYEMLIEQHPEYKGRIEMVEKEERKR